MFLFLVWVCLESHSFSWGQWGFHSFYMKSTIKFRQWWSVYLLKFIEPVDKQFILWLVAICLRTDATISPQRDECQQISRSTSRDGAMQAWQSNVCVWLHLCDRLFILACSYQSVSVSPTAHSSLLQAESVNACFCICCWCNSFQYDLLSWAHKFSMLKTIQTQHTHLDYYANKYTNIHPVTCKQSSWLQLIGELFWSLMSSRMFCHPLPDSASISALSSLHLHATHNAESWLISPWENVITSHRGVTLSWKIHFTVSQLSAALGRLWDLKSCDSTGVELMFCTKVCVCGPG